MWYQGEMKAKAPWVGNLFDSLVGKDQMIRWVRKEFPGARSMNPPTDGRGIYICNLYEGTAEYWEEEQLPSGYEFWDHSANEWWDLWANGYTVPYAEQAISYSNHMQHLRTEHHRSLQNHMSHAVWFGGRKVGTPPLEEALWVSEPIWSSNPD